MGMAVGMPEVKGLPAAVDLAKNPLAETHEFKQACSICYVKTGENLFLLCYGPIHDIRISVWCNFVSHVHVHRAWSVGLHTSHRGT